MVSMNSVAPSSPVQRLSRPLPNLAAWLAHVRAAPIPVLTTTANAVRELAENEDAVDAHLLADSIGGDPLMTLKLLAHVGSRSRRDTDVESVVGALVLMGIGPFFREFKELATLEDTLGDWPEALEGARRVIHEAALLHDFSELLLWCHAPGLALEIAARQAADTTLRTASVQREVLGIELRALQQSLMKAWRLPELLVRLDDENHAERTQVKYVQFAVRVARHTASGWDNAALPDDVADIGAMLQLEAAPTLALLHDIDS
jgi:HD-like signal output (HDOD) protein